MHSKRSKKKMKVKIHNLYNVYQGFEQTQLRYGYRLKLISDNDPAAKKIAAFFKSG